MSANTGGSASEKTLLDEFAGQALAGFFGYISETQAYLKDAGHDGIKRDQVAKECYEQAQAMLTEKARREADHSEDKLGKVDHSPDVTKMVALEAANRDLVDALESLRTANAALVERVRELQLQLSGRDPIVDAELASLPASLLAVVNRGCK